MKHTTGQYEIACGCRSVDECAHNDFAELKALYACVDDFAAEMKWKLRKQYFKGYSGWDDPGWTEETILTHLRAHVDKGDMIDVADFAMFVWNKRV